MTSLLGERERDAVSELWQRLERDVDLRLDLGPAETPVALLAAGGRELDPNAETRRLVEELVGLGDRVRLETVEHEQPGRYPTLTIADGVRYVGLPWGYELASFVYGVAAAGAADSALSPESRERLAAIERPATIDVFVTPT